jgi:hypothetical protein
VGVLTVEPMTISYLRVVERAPSIIRTGDDWAAPLVRPSRDMTCGLRDGIQEFRRERAIVESVADIVGVLAAAVPQKKADLYDGLGLSLTYEPGKAKGAGGGGPQMCTYGSCRMELNPRGQ